MEIIFNEINEDFIGNLPNLKFTDEIKEKFNEVCYRLYLNMREFYNNEEMPVSHYVYFLIENNIIVGCCSFYCNYDSNFSELFAIYIDKEFRRRHLTYKIISKLLVFFKEQNIQNIKIPLTKDSCLGIYILDDFFTKLREEHKSFEFDIWHN